MVSLAKLKNKYFATRCADGHVNVWSATNHPDRLFPLYNMDADEEALAPLQPPPPEPEPVVVEEKKPKLDEDGNPIEDEEEEQPEEEEDPDAPKKKKVVEPVKPIAPTLIGRPEPSVMDRMIEIKWKGLQLNSSAVVCTTNYTERLTIISEIELKTRRRTLKKTWKNNNSPTAMYQVDEDFLLIGTT